MSRRKHNSAPTAPQQAIPRIRSTAPTTAPAPAKAPVSDSYRDSLPVCHRHAAGIDVGSRSHWVAAQEPRGPLTSPSSTAATTATAHKLARLLYQTLKTGQLPAKEASATYAARQRDQAIAALTRKARRLGLQVVAPGEIVEAAPSLP